MRARDHTFPESGVLVRAFWLAKFWANRRRDARVVRELTRAGYEVAVVWECEVVDPRRLRSRLARLIRVARRRARG